MRRDSVVPVSLRDIAVIDVFSQGPGNKIGTLMFAGDAPEVRSNGCRRYERSYARRQSRDRRPAKKQGMAAMKAWARAALAPRDGLGRVPKNVTISNVRARRARCTGTALAWTRSTCSRHLSMAQRVELT